MQEVTARQKAIRAVERAKLQALNGFFTQEQITELEKLIDRVEVAQHDPNQLKMKL